MTTITTHGVTVSNPTSIVKRPLLTLLLCLLTTSVWAQAYPTKPIKMIVPYGAGGATDVIARMIASRLADRLKQPVVVENRPGAGSITGVAALKTAAPDGYTMGMLVSASAAQPWLTKNIPFDIRKDFIPLTLGFTGPLVLTVSANSPVRTLADYVAYAKANPGKAFNGGVGIGTTTHLALEMINQATGINVSFVSFKGAPEGHAAVVGGEILSTVDSYSGPKALIDAGRMRVIVQTGKERLEALPNVPTVAETYPGFEISSWVGFAVPLGTPRAIVDLLTSETRNALVDPVVRKTIAEGGVGGIAGGGTPAEFQQRINDDYAKFGRVIQAGNIKPE